MGAELEIRSSTGAARAGGKRVTAIETDLGTLDGAGTLALPATFPAALAASQQVLGALFALSGASGTFVDTGLSVTLPSAGTYLLIADIHAVIRITAGTYGTIYVKLRNSTDSADVANSERRVVYVETLSTYGVAAGSLSAIVTVAASKVIKLYAARETDGTISNSFLQSAAAGRTALLYVKLS